MNKNMNLEKFIEVLHKLDDRLDTTININAIGGFSIILNSAALNLDLNRMSKDIDFLTKTWKITNEELNYKDIEKIIELNKNIEDIIWDIGEEYQINDCDGWLNNSWYDSKLFDEELEQDIEWIEYTEESFKHIILKYADLESIFLFKIRAINDIVSGNSSIHDRPRDNDIYDVINILKIFNEDDIKNIKNPKMSKALEIYMPAINWLDKNIRIY